MSEIPSVLVSGIVLGSLYALMAAGLSLVWSTLGIFNFAHGVLMMLGAYVTWTLSDSAGLGWGLAIGASLGVAALIGVGALIEWSLVRPFLKRKNSVLLVVITTLAGAIFIENAALIGWGPRLKQLPPIASGQVNLLGVPVSTHETLIILLSPLLLAGVWAFLKFTMPGSAIRAVAQNQESALLIGVNVQRMYLIAFSLSASLAAIAGILLGSLRFLAPTMGNEPLMKAMIVAIFGGLGSLWGTIGGAYVIGIIESSSNAIVGFFWTPAILFAILIGVLVFRPNGLFGKK